MNNSFIFINKEICNSIEQLRSYFNYELRAGSTIYEDLLSYGQNGVIASWLKNQGEAMLANAVDSIVAEGDADYIRQLGELLTGKKVTTNIQKKSFKECFEYLDINCEENTNEAKIQVKLKILYSANENFRLTVRGGLGEKGMTINPSNYDEGKNVSFIFVFHKSINNELLHRGQCLGNVSVFADNEQIGGTIHRVNINNCMFSFVHIPGADAFKGFYITETPVTIEQFKVLATEAGDEEIIGYIESSCTCKCNEYSFAAVYTVYYLLRLLESNKHSFTIPSKEQYLYMARSYSSRIKWCSDFVFNSSDEKLIWEMTSYNYYDIYCLLGFDYNEKGTLDINGFNAKIKGELGKNVAFRLVCTEENFKKLANK